MKKFLTLISAVLISISTLSSSTSQEGATIEGRVVLSGQIVFSAYVLLQNANGVFLQSTISDEDGYFYFYNVAPGAYLLHGYYSEYSDQYQCVQRVVILPNHTYYIQNLELQ